MKQQVLGSPHRVLRASQSSVSRRMRCILVSNFDNSCWEAERALLVVECPLVGLASRVLTVSLKHDERNSRGSGKMGPTD